MSIRSTLSNWLLPGRAAQLEAATTALRELYQAWPDLVREAAQSGRFVDERGTPMSSMSEMDSRLLDMLRQQVAYSGSIGYAATETDRRRTVDLSRRMYDGDPQTENAIGIHTDFGFGVALSLKAKDPQADEYLQAFWNARANQYLLSQREIDELAVKLYRDGDFLLIFYQDKFDGRSTLRLAETVEIVGGPYGSGILTMP